MKVAVATEKAAGRSQRARPVDKRLRLETRLRDLEERQNTHLSRYQSAHDLLREKAELEISLTKRQHELGQAISTRNIAQNLKRKGHVANPSLHAEDVKRLESEVNNLKDRLNANALSFEDVKDDYDRHAQITHRFETERSKIKRQLDELGSPPATIPEEVPSQVDKTPVVSPPVKEARVEEVHETYSERRGGLGLFGLIAVVVIALLLIWFLFTHWPFGATAPVHPLISPAQPVVTGQYKVVSIVVTIPRLGNKDLDLLSPDSVHTVPIDGSGKSTYTVKVKADRTTGTQPVSGTPVSFDGKSSTLDNNGLATFSENFTCTQPISCQETLTIRVNGDKAASFLITVAKFLPDNVGPPALTKPDMSQIANASARFRLALQAALPGVNVNGLTLTGLDACQADGKSTMISMDRNGNVSGGGTPPAGQWMWCATFTNSSGTSFLVLINPICLNTVPGKGIPSPAPKPVPSPVPKASPSKNPANAPSPPPPPPPNQSPAPTYPPPSPVGSSITIDSSVSCGSGCWEVEWSWSGSSSGKLLYGLTGNSMTNVKNGVAIAPGKYKVQITNAVPGSSYTFTAAAWMPDGTQQRINGSFIAQ